MKLHLGCWHRHIPGFVHVDLCDMDHIDYYQAYFPHMDKENGILVSLNVEVTKNA